MEGFVRSKIICTIGPSSRSPEILRALKEAGMDVARVNLSHGTFNEHRLLFKDLRKLERVAVLFDLPGPKMRLGEFTEPVTLESGAKVVFTVDEVKGSSRLIPVNYEKLPAEVNPGGQLFINDGLIEVKVTSVHRNLRGFDAVVVSGGEVSSHKGLNAPGAALSLRPPTEQDMEGIKFGVEEGADWFAASFIRSAADVERVKSEIANAGGDQPVISKIEHGEALVNIDEIIAASDGVMVARGDLGIEVKPWDVPLIQKRIITKCNEVGKPVIVATQMLESMVDNPRPTRAEASDVANALLDGADAVMLSEETATGAHPIEAVAAMTSICRVVEADTPQHRRESRLSEGHPIADIIGSLAARAAEVVKPAAIIVVTRSGFSSQMVSKHRPTPRILVVSPDKRVMRRMHLYWGVEPLNLIWTSDRDDLIIRAVKLSLEKGYMKPEDSIMVVSGSTLEAPGRTSTLEILKVEEIIRHAERRD